MYERLRASAIARVAVAGSLCACPAAVASDTALTPLNPVAGFDVSLSGWYTDPAPGGVMYWVPDDAAGNPLSGAARLAGPAGVYSMRSCFVPTGYMPRFYYVATASARAIGEAARVDATVVVGFAGDLPADFDSKCPGPAIHRSTFFNEVVAPAALFVSRESQHQGADGYGLPISIDVTVYKPDASDIVVDDLQVFVTDHVFVDDF
jgi:hypothetical protein